MKIKVKNVGAGLVPALNPTWYRACPLILTDIHTNIVPGTHKGCPYDFYYYING